MMKLQTYAGFSFLATITAICYAFSSRGQFYPAMVYLSTSKICFVLLLNMGLVLMCIAWQLVKKLFLGTLREAEVERLNEQSWREVVEILFAVTIFRQDFSVTFLAMVTALLLIKALHWLAQKRVEYIETTPSVPRLSHIRIVSFMVFLLIIDSLFLSSSVKSLMKSFVRQKQASVALFFAFEYMILATTTLSTFLKYIFYVSDMLMDGQWEQKAVFTFYLDLISDLIHLSLYMLFFIAIFLNYGVPLHLIRELYETFRNFRMRVADYIRYRRITSNMNDRFPDASPEELSASDATCIICREEMTTAKKLLCGHLFHVQCLRSWLERQHTCPTCRAQIIPSDNGPTGSRHQHGAQADSHQQAADGSNRAADSAAGDARSQRQAKLQAAVSAASLYEKSFAHNPAINRRLVYPQSSRSNQTAGLNGGPTQQAGEASTSQLPQPQVGGYSFAPMVSHDPEEVALLYNAQERFLRSQIELLQTHLQVLKQQQQQMNQSCGIVRAEVVAEDKGKAVATQPTGSGLS